MSSEQIIFLYGCKFGETIQDHRGDIRKAYNVEESQILIIFPS